MRALNLTLRQKNEFIIWKSVWWRADSHRFEDFAFLFCILVTLEYKTLVTCSRFVPACSMERVALVGFFQLKNSIDKDSPC